MNGSSISRTTRLMVVFVLITVVAVGLVGYGAYAYGQKMIWPNVANSYLKVYKNIVNISENTG